MSASRPIQISYDGLARVDGSARFSFGDTVALASVSGPIEVRLAAELPSQATFDVSVRPLSNVPSTESKSQAATIRSAIAPSLILNKNPRTLIQLVIQTLTLALLNAGSVPMRGVVCAIAIGKTRDGELLVDPEEARVAELIQGGCFAFMVADGAGLESNSTTVWTNWRALEGTFDETGLMSAREAAKDAIKRVYTSMKSSLMPERIGHGDDDKMEI
ncbi:exosome component Rrp46 [Ephemerocybe angulata]|uniref:Exosome component Rrp46 n=1 Tax=Ephemerocybe angulata TaxID=980116 RepID=A0A8H6HGI3_9AGAR|nr:exosome component Rrp46 [Tulosesus angulatus]